MNPALTPSIFFSKPNDYFVLISQWARCLQAFCQLCPRHSSSEASLLCLAVLAWLRKGLGSRPQPPSCPASPAPLPCPYLHVLHLLGSVFLKTHTQWLVETLPSKTLGCVSILERGEAARWLWWDQSQGCKCGAGYGLSCYLQPQCCCVREEGSLLCSSPALPQAWTGQPSYPGISGGHAA